MKKLLTSIFMLVFGVTMLMAQNNVTFRVNMGKQTALGNFTPATDTVWVRGSFNGWGTDNKLTRPAGDSIWSATISLPEGSIEYKFFHNHNGGENWESIANRSFTVPAGGATLDVVYFDNVDWAPVVNLPVSFSCNMELERLSGRFDPALDTLSVNGSFNGWASKVDIMTPGSNPDIYEKEVMIDVQAGTVLAFKYWYTPNQWESVPNREYTITQADITNGFAIASEASYNNGTLSTVINQACTIKLTCNTNGAKDPNGVPFSSVDNVIVAGSSAPLSWPSGGWPTSDSGLVIKLYDNGTNGDITAGDKIFSKDIVFPAYTSLGVEYKYGINFGLPNNGGANDNEGGVGNNHTLPWQINYVSATAVDTFGVLKPADLINIVTDVRELGNGVPSAFELGQNYPNPFNPSTSIRFSIPVSGMVSLKVYNITGQEVASLVNEVKDAGNYVVNFDASKLTSGIYFYTITSGKFTETKKMLLLK